MTGCNLVRPEAVVHHQLLVGLFKCPGTFFALHVEYLPAFFALIKSEGPQETLTVFVLQFFAIDVQRAGWLLHMTRSIRLNPIIDKRPICLKNVGYVDTLSAVAPAVAVPCAYDVVHIGCAMYTMCAEQRDHFGVVF